MKVYLATDHAGFELKEKVKQWLKKEGYADYDEIKELLHATFI